MGTALVTGSGSQWLMSRDLWVGQFGDGELTIENGGVVESQSAQIGSVAGSSGTALVTGTNSQWANSNMFLGLDGTGELTVADGGSVTSSQSFLGRFAGGSGTALVTGADSLWSVTGPLYVGHTGTGDLTVSDGGSINSSFGFIGELADSSGTALVTGPTSLWDLSSSIYVGNNGTGELTVSNGGVIDNGSGILGVAPGSSGTATITGAGSQWTMSSNLDIGRSGTGHLTIQDGGVADSTSGTLGLLVGSSGTVLVTGTESEWNMSSDLYVGDSGIGDLTIANGGIVNNQIGYIGNTANSIGTASVTGVGSVWTQTSSLYTGFAGAGDLTVSNGGVLNTGSGWIAYDTGSSGSATVTGSGSEWNLGGFVLHVGRLGTGELEISDGGAANSGVGTVGRDNGGVGAALVTGTGSEWTVQDSFSIGVNGVGTLTLSEGGAAIVSGGTDAMYLGQFATGSGTLNIGAASGDAAAAAGTLNAGTLEFGDGTGTLVFNHTDLSETFAFAPDITSGAGSAAIDHYAGYTQLTGDSSGFDGTTTVHGGTLAVENMLGGGVDVMDGGTLGGSGDITGTITVGDGAVLAPGSSIGTMDVVGDVVQGGGSTYEVEVDSAGNGDLLNITGSYTIDPGATLAVLPENGTDDGSTYAASTEYTIVTASTGVSGTFDTVTEDFFFLEAMVDYDANNVYLTLSQIFDFVDAAMTPNEMAVAGGLDGLADGDPLKDAMLLILSEEEAQDAFAQLSGEIHPSLRGALRANDGRAVGAAQSRIRTAALDDTGEPGNVFWATGFGNWRTTDAASNTHELGNDAYGVVAGVDRAMGDHARIGLMGGYSQTDASQSVLRSEAEADSYTAGLYGGTDDGFFVLDFGALYSWHNVDTARAITNPLSETLTASYDARSLQLFGEAGIRIGANQVTATPFAGIAYGNVETDGFAEQGGAAALSAASETITTTFATLGVRPEIELSPNINARGMVGWRRALGDTDTDTSFSFDGVNRFSVTGAPLAENSFVSEFGLDMFTAGGVSIGASYVGEHGDGVTSNGFDLRFSTTF